MVVITVETSELIRELQHKAHLGDVMLQALAELPAAQRDAILSWINAFGDVDERRYVDAWLAKVDYKHE